MLERVSRIVREHAEAPFLIDAESGARLTYADIDTIARGLSAELEKRQVGRGDRVALILKNSPEFAVLYFACLFIGAVAVPIDPTLHRREIDAILQIAQPALVVDSPATSDSFDRAALQPGTRFWRVVPAADRVVVVSHTIDSWSLGQALAIPPPGWRPLRHSLPGDLFSINFTSGTTSLPKGVAHSVHGLLANAVAFNDELGIDSENRFLHVFPMAYMAGFLNTLLCPFMAGASVVLGGRFGAQHTLRFWTSVQNHAVNTLWLAPTMLATILKVDRDPAVPEYCRRHIRTVSVGTAPLPRSLKHAFERAYGVELFESYGLSELLFVTTNSFRATRHEGSVGRALPGIEIRVVTDTGAVAASDADGEIQVKTPYAMVGYLDAETSQPEPPRSEWFSTGDVGHISADGSVFITSRKKDLIIRGGVNVSPRAIEDVLSEHRAVAQVAVIGLPHELYGEEIVAVLKLKPGHALRLETASLMAFCKDRVAAAAVPSRFVEVQEFPLTVSGKIQKARLRQDLIEGAASHAP